jgi:hypothetical protein
VYVGVLVLHSLVRWLFLGLALLLVTRSFFGWRRGREPSHVDERLHVAFVASTDLQLVLGLGLYLFLGPFARAVFSAPARAMKDATLRFFGVEHVSVMLLVVVLVHVGRVRARRAPSSSVRQRRVFATTLAALLLTLVAIPWPFLRHGRPLLRAGATPPASDTRPARAAPPPRVCPPVYQNRCAACHGETGRGDGFAARSLKPPPRDFADRAWRERKTDADLHDIIREGGAAHGLSAGMPAHPDLSEAEIEALVGCVLGFSGARP